MKTREREKTYMKKKYHFEYEESEELYIDMYRLYYRNRNTYMYKLVIFFVGLLVLAVRVTSDISLLLSPFIIKFLCVWALIFGAAYLINRYLMPGFNRKKGEKRGKDIFQQRMEKNEPGMKMIIDCYDEEFTISYGDHKNEYTYWEVSHLYDTSLFFGAVVGGPRGDRSMAVFPKNCMKNGEQETFRRFIDSKCVNAHKGFQKI